MRKRVLPEVHEISPVTGGEYGEVYGAWKRLEENVSLKSRVEKRRND